MMDNNANYSLIIDDDANVQCLLVDLRQIIEQARGRVAATTNYELTMMYWHIGERINRDNLDNIRAAYGQKIVATLSRQLWWSHFVEVLPLKDELQREFYLTFASNEHWGVRRLRKEIDGMLFERTAIASKPEDLVKNELANLRDNDTMSPDLVFKSPYFLEFTGLKGMYSERSLEDSLVANLEQFMLEMGKGFAFVERQKRMIIDGEDFYLDLLFFHRRLHRLIAVDLKLGRFKAQYKGQMELYLRWLEANEVEKGEEAPLGLLLCTEGSEEQIELLQLDNAGIKVAQYMTELPPRDVLMNQIQKSLSLAKSKWNNLDDKSGTENNCNEQED